MSRDRLSEKKYICISSVILNWLDMHRRLQRFLKGVDAGRATVWKHINNLVDDGLLKTNHPSTDRAYTPVGYGIRKISKEIK